MKLLISVITIFSASIFTTGCGAERYATQKRNMMLISKSEMPANSNYKDPGKRKTNKTKQKKARTKSLF